MTGMTEERFDCFFTTAALRNLARTMPSSEGSTTAVCARTAPKLHYIAFNQKTDSIVDETS